jgi:hypothetical protein
VFSAGDCQLLDSVALSEMNWKTSLLVALAAMLATFVIVCGYEGLKADKNSGRGSFPGGIYMPPDSSFGEKKWRAAVITSLIAGLIAFAVATNSPLRP